MNTNDSQNANRNLDEINEEILIVILMRSNK